MDKKTILIIAVLIVVIAALAFGILNSLNSAPKVHAVDVDVGTFNCSENINFTLRNSSNGFYEYSNENQTYTVKVMKFNESDYYHSYGYNMALDKIRGYPSSTVDGVIVYNSTANVGQYVGQLRHMALIDNNDKNINIEISTPSVDETVLIANSFRFK